MALSSLTAYSNIPANSAATTGLFDRRYQLVQDNVATLWGQTNPAFANVFVVTDPRYNAKGTGTDNDTSAIQAACDACSAAGGGAVYCPKGTYLISSLQVAAGVVIVGAGMGATTFTKTGSESGASSWMIRLMGNHCGLRDCTVQGPGATGVYNGSCVGITNGASYCEIARVEAKNYHIGILVGGIDNQPTLRWDDCSYNVVRDCYVHDVDNVTISFYAPVLASGNLGIGCTLGTVDPAATGSGSGAELRNQRGSKFVDCHSDGARTAFRFEEVCVDSIIEGCTSRNAVVQGFYAIGYVSTTGASGETHDCKFIGCHSANDNRGFTVQNANRIQHVGCTTNGTTNRTVSYASHGFVITGVAGPASQNDDISYTGCEAHGTVGSGFHVEFGGASSRYAACKSYSNGVYGLFFASTAAPDRANIDMDVRANAAGGVRILTGDNGYLRAYAYDNTGIGVEIATGRTGWLIEGRAIGTANQTRGLFDNDRVQNIGDWIVQGHSSLDRRAARWDRVRALTFSLTTPAAGVTTDADVTSTVSGNKRGITLPQAGSIVGIAADLASACTGGTQTITALLNGLTTGFAVTIDSTNSQSARTTQGVNINVFAAGDRLGGRFSSSTTWAPSTSGVQTIFVEFHTG